MRVIQLHSHQLPPLWYLAAMRPILVALLLAASMIAEAQQAKKVQRIGYLSPIDAAGESDRGVGISRALRERGQVEGQNLAFEYSYADGKLDRLPELAATLVRSKVDLIIAIFYPGVVAAKKATDKIPIVMVSVGADPVEAGLVDSFARPGGNVTGIATLAQELGGKRLELFKEALPTISRVAALYDSTNAANVVALKELQNAAPGLKLSVQPVEVRGNGDFARAFSEISKQRSGGLHVSGGPLLNAQGKRIVDFTLRNRLPSIYVARSFVEAGGLMSYATDNTEQYRRVAYFVDRILTGTSPTALPVERPMKFDFAINLQTAKRIGVTIPQSVLFRADRVIK